MKIDIVLLGEINKISKSIYKLYLKLEELEKAGKKNSREYRETLEYITIAREYNLNKMNQLLDSQEFFDINEFTRYVTNRYKTSLEILDLDDSNIEVLRLFLYTLIEATKQNKNINSSTFMDAFDEEGNITKQEISLSDENIELAKKENDFTVFRIMFLNRTLINLVERKIKFAKSKEMKDLYIKFKYRLLYLYPFLEQDFLSNTDCYYDIREDYSTLSLIRAEYPNEYEDIYMTQHEQAISLILGDLSTIDDSYQDTVKNKFLIEIKELFIKACIYSCLEPEEYIDNYEYIRDEYFKTTDSKKAKKIMKKALKRKDLKIKNVD